MGLANPAGGVRKPAGIERLGDLARLDVPDLPAAVRVYRAAYRRVIPPHYRGNPLTSEFVRLNLILVHGGQLIVPDSPQATFNDLFHHLEQNDPHLHRRIISPVGTARLAAVNEPTPIKRLSEYNLDGWHLPGEPELYGWEALSRQAARSGMDLALIFQGNGLYFNRGSAFLHQGRLLLEPDGSLRLGFCDDLTLSTARQMGIRGRSIKRPLVFFVQHPGGAVRPLIVRFAKRESYPQGLDRIERLLGRLQEAVGFAASPPLVLPGSSPQPRFLDLPAVLARFHANDIRHYLFCPYEGAVLLYPELSRSQSLHPNRLARSLSGQRADRVCLPLKETLLYYQVAELKRILENRGYGGRFHFRERNHQVYLFLNPLEGVYSHLLPFATRQGLFGLIQTSGTHRNITGNDGPTLDQLSAMLADINRQPPFDRDPFWLVVSGSQGNDVPNVVVRDQRGQPDLLYRHAPTTALDRSLLPRGRVTTPRLGIALPRE